MQWQIISDSLHTFQPVNLGFTNAMRGVIQLPDTKRVFVKIANDELTLQWIRKEISVYHSLKATKFPYIPELIAVNPDRSGFALEVLDETAGWEWHSSWSDARIAKTFEAMDALAGVSKSQFDEQLVVADPEQTNPWRFDRYTSATITKLRTRLESDGYHKLANQLDELKDTFDYHFDFSKLVHNDVRADNCAWNPETNQVKLIDWNWLQLGDMRIDQNALLVDIAQKRELPMDVRDRLDADTLLWLTGYWLSHYARPAKPSMSDGTKLREFQYQAALTAYQLYSYKTKTIL